MTGKPLLVIYKCTHNIRRGTEYLFLLPRKEFAYWSCQSSFNIRWRKKPALPVTQPVNLLLPNRSFLFHVEFHHSSIMNKYCRWSYSLQYLVCTKVYVYMADTYPLPNRENSPASNPRVPPGHNGQFRIPLTLMDAKSFEHH